MITECLYHELSKLQAKYCTSVEKEAGATLSRVHKSWPCKYLLKCQIWICI